MTQHLVNSTLFIFRHCIRSHISQTNYISFHLTVGCDWYFSLVEHDLSVSCNWLCNTFQLLWVLLDQYIGIFSLYVLFSVLRSNLLSSALSNWFWQSALKLKCLGTLQGACSWVVTVFVGFCQSVVYFVCIVSYLWWCIAFITYYKIWILLIAEEHTVPCNVAYIHLIRILVDYDCFIGNYRTLL